MTDRELITHWKSHYDRLNEELSASRMTVSKLTEEIRKLKVTRFDTISYYGEIDFSNERGWFEHSVLGEDGGGGAFYFDTILKDGKKYHTIYDYDDCYDIPKEVKSALMQYNIIMLEID
jgi:hypothetical protein